MNFDKTILGWAAGAACLLATGGALAKGNDAPDAARMWQQFLATANADKAYAALDVLDAVEYDVDSVDAKLCREHAGALQAATATAPVSMAIRRAAFLCADAVGDAAAAEREMGVLAALSQHGLKQAGVEPALGEPIRLMGLADAYAFVASLGMESRYAYYEQLRHTRYFPYVIAAWDPDTKRERHYRFDFADTAYSLSRDNTYFGYPMLRVAMAEAFIQGGVDSDQLAAVDHAALQAAAQTSAPEDKVAKLRRGANAGGVLSTTTWLLVCARNAAYAGCADGLVDALLPQAEEQHAAFMTLLAFAHLQGIGVEPDPAAAWTLLDAADRIAPQDAIVQFVALWTNAYGIGKPLPGEAEKRLQRARANAKVVNFVALRRQATQPKPSLDAADLAFLASPAVNRAGEGHAVLVDYYEALGDKPRAWEHILKTSEAGHTLGLARHGHALVQGDVQGIARDIRKGEELLKAAAHQGSPWAARYVASRRYAAADFAGTERWLSAAAGQADPDAIMFLASLYESERAGVSAKADRAVAIYNILAAEAGPEGAPARRALAQMALDGRGMGKDPAKAREWLLADANRGDHDSEAVLGFLYLKGKLGKVNESEGRRWMERALAGGSEAAFSDFGHWLFDDKGTPKSRAEALAVWARGDAAGHRSSTNNFAWALCTTQHADAYDPARGAELSKRLGEIDVMNPGWLDTVAACDAAVGNFKRAVELQERAAAEMAAFDAAAPEQQGEGKEPGYRKRLALYKAGKPYRGDNAVD